MDELNLQQLKNLVQELSWNDGYGCYTRAGFEKLIWPQICSNSKYIIFFDVDDMHGINAHYGYDGANDLIKDILGMRESDFMAGQWFSGDEFIVAITDNAPHRLYDSNPIEFASRLQEIFIEHEISATFAVAPVISEDLYTNVAPAHHLVQEAKNNGRRGTINEVGGVG
jgi:GGDEF domain-containing protein